MALATRCPHCKTTFRVASDQLKLRGGIVRCGTCHQVFDGNAALVDLDAIAPVAPSSPPEPPATPAEPVVASPAPAPAFAPEAVQPEASPQPEAIDAAPPEPEAIIGVADAEPVAEAEPAIEFRPEPEPEPEPAAQSEPEPAAQLLAEAAPTLPAEEAPARPPRFELDLPPAAPLPPEEPEEVAPIEGVLGIPELTFGDAPAPAPRPKLEPAVVEFKVFADPDFDAHLDAPPPPEDDYIPSPSEQFDQQLAALDARASEKPAPAYVLDFDLSDPEGYVPEPEPLPVWQPPAHGDNWPASELPPDPEPEEEHAAEHAPEHDPIDSLDAELLPEPDPFCDVEFDSADDDVRELSLADEPGASFSSEGPDSTGINADLEYGPLPLVRPSAASEDVLAAPEPVAPRVHAAPEPEHDEPEFVRLAREQELAARRRTIIMAAGSVLLVLVLLGQAVTTFRNVLVARYPQMKPLVSAGCAVLRCKIELPAQIETLTVETGELQSVGASTFRYTTVLSNKSDLIQTWPYIELELKDADDKVVVRRVFTPPQYLPQGVVPAKGFAANSEQTVNIRFALKQLKATGFKIFVFYP